MPEIPSRRGCRGDLCLAHGPNVAANPSKPPLPSDGWHRHFGFRIPREQTVCDGCLAENRRLIGAACPVCPSVPDRGLENCGARSGFLCCKPLERLVNREEVTAWAAGRVSEEERARFISPVENRVSSEGILESQGPRSP